MINFLIGAVVFGVGCLFGGALALSAKNKGDK